MRNVLMSRDAILLSLLSGAMLLPSTVYAQSGGKKPVTKPPTAGKSSGPVVLGTTQLPGEFGKMGVTYTMGKSYPLNVTLKSADYSIAPISIGNRTVVPKAEEKLLLLHYTVQNPTPREISYVWSDLLFTAVDSKDINHEYIQTVYREGDREGQAIRLKPGQKIDVATVIIVPAAGVVPKLIIERQKGEPVVRYDLRGKVTPLPALAADTADTSGATALKIIPARPGIFYPLGVFNTRLDEVAYVDGPLLRREPGEGKRWLTAIFTIKNTTNRTERYVWSDFLPELRDADGEKSEYNQSILKASRDEAASDDVAAGEEARIRFYFALPEKVEGKTLRLAEGKKVDVRVARIFAFDLTHAADPAKKP